LGVMKKLAQNFTIGFWLVKAEKIAAFGQK
jgi:hypothetical protein